MSQSGPVLKTGNGRQGHSWVRIPPPPLTEPQWPMVDRKSESLLAATHLHVVLAGACQIAICGAFNSRPTVAHSLNVASPVLTLLASPLPLDASAVRLGVRVDGRVLPFDLHAPGVAVAWPDRAAQKPACPAAAD